MTRPVFSIIVPVYFNELNIPDTVPQLLSLQASLPDYSLELVFVDDGSRDDSLAALRDFQQRYPSTIRVVKLTRNFGSMAAIQAGLTVARGDCVGMIAADLQDPPELFVEMLRHWERGIKAVFAVRADREESRLQTFFSNSYYSLMRTFALPDYPSGGFDFFLIDRQVVEQITNIREKNTNVMSLVFWLGFEPVAIPYVRRARQKGKSRWTLSKKIKLFIDSFVAFSYAPIRFLSAFGLLIAFSAFLYAVYIIWLFLARGIAVKGYAPVVILLALTSGIQMTMLGVLGEYLWRTLDESRRRPAFVIDEVFSEADPVHDVAAAATSAEMTAPRASGLAERQASRQDPVAR